MTDFCIRSEQLGEFPVIFDHFFDVEVKSVIRTNGDYGDARLATLYAPEWSSELFTLRRVGWKHAEDGYDFSWPKGLQDHLLFFTTKGKGVLHLQGKEYTLSPGTVALVPRNVKNRYYTPQGGVWEFYWIHSGGEETVRFLDRLAEKSGSLFCVPADFSYPRRLEKLLQLCWQRPGQFEWELSRQLSTLLHEVALDFCADEPAAILSQRAIAFMEQNYARSIPLEEIAHELFVSSGFLSRTFKKQTGGTPHQYLTRYRLMMAAQMLEFSSRSIEEIAEQTGFSSSSHMISRFKEVYGCTPLRYREQAAGIR